jgi:copper chaperone CopZ
MKASVLLTIATSASASLCCIVPVLGVIGGSGGLLASISWLEPLRPYFIAATIGILGFAWFKTLRRIDTDQCGCNPAKPSFFQSKGVLTTITVLSLLLMTFPTYSKIFQQSTQIAGREDQEKLKTITLGVSGMTCASCEHHIESEVIKLSGVKSVKASYSTKSATIEFVHRKVDEDKIIAAINSTGYTVNKNTSMLGQSSKSDCCTKGSCTPETCSNMPKISVPKEKSENLKIMSSIEDLKIAFNRQEGKVKFVAILSSTCGWCLQGAEAVQKSVIQKMADKNISVLIVWTNMLKSDDQENAYKAASLFKDPSIVQYFDAKNQFGDLVARRLNPNGEKAWDIYMFFDKEDQWTSAFPRPFEYAHQLSASLHPWVDETRYFCGDELTKRLTAITNSL